MPDYTLTDRAVTLADMSDLDDMRTNHHGITAVARLLRRWLTPSPTHEQVMELEFTQALGYTKAICARVGQINTSLLDAVTPATKPH